MNKFVPMYDLDRLTVQELTQYYFDACQYHGVPPELNVLAFTYMDSGDGARHRVLYAKKGATDIIRERLGISVVDLRKEVFNGTLTYTALGKNKDGRLEIAVGASYIDNLTGRALEVAIMVAQTRAVRRMTLQFAGAGLLDETELHQDAKTADIKDIKEAITAAQPVNKPNTAPGKDITEPIINIEALKTLKNELVNRSLDPQNPLNEGVSLKEISPTPTQLEAQQVLSKVPEPVLAKAAGEVAPEPPKRRQRAKPVELDTPFSFDNPVSARVEKPVIGEKSPNVDIPESKRMVTPEPPLFSPKAMEGMFHPEPVFVLERLDKTNEKLQEMGAPPITTLPDATGIPSELEMKKFRDRLFKYTNEILPKAGMSNTENIGSPGMKVRLFAQIKFNRVLNQLSVVQWEEMLNLFDDMVPVELVNFIDAAVKK